MLQVIFSKFPTIQRRFFLSNIRENNIRFGKIKPIIPKTTKRKPIIATQTPSSQQTKINYDDFLLFYPWKNVQYPKNSQGSE